MMKLCCYIIFLFFLKQSAEGNLNSVIRLSQALGQENNAISKTKNLVQNIREQMKVIQTYVETYRDIQSKGLSPIELVSHPINGYMVMKRLVRGWDEVETSKETLEKLIADHTVDMEDIPTERDLNVSALSIIVMQDTYQLDANMISEGLIQDYRGNRKIYQSSFKLSASDCFYIGGRAAMIERYNRAVEWYSVALNKTRRGDDSISQSLIQDSLKNAMQRHDEKLEKHGSFGEKWRTYDRPFNEELAKAEKYKNGILRTKFYPKLYQSQSIEEEIIHSEKLCRGENLLPGSVYNKLNCKYITNNNPYLYLMPLKLEEQSLDPYIVVFREFLSEPEIEQILDLAVTKLQPSTLYSSSDEAPDTGIARTSDTAWLKNSEKINAITKRIEMATRMILRKNFSSELYQVANYGIGGQFVTHNDYLQESKEFDDSFARKAMGDRLSTFMAYLSDVDAGGATVFPRAGVSITPQRGSAAFWWNLYKNGEGDENLTHAGCPVLHGTKWIINKWTRTHNQMFTAKCGTHLLEKFDASFWSSGYSV